MGGKTDSRKDLLSKLRDVVKRNAKTRPDIARVITEFVEWSTPFIHLWTHIRLSVAAFRIEGEWVVRAAGIVLADARPVVVPPVGTDDVWTGRWVLPLSTLPRLFHDVMHGAIAGIRNPLGEPLALREAKGKPLPNVNGASYEASPRMSGSGFGSLCRYVVDLQSSVGMTSMFKTTEEAYAWNKRAERVFGAQGYGDFETVVKRLDISADRTNLRWDQPSALRFTAPVRLSIEAAAESPDRNQLMIQVSRGPTVRTSHAIISIEPRDAESVALRIPVPETGPATMRNPGNENLTLSLLYNGERVQRINYFCRPLLREHLRYIALRALEARPLMRDGLLQSGSKLDAPLFERSVAHLLGLLGFSTFWWGPPRGVSEMPAEQADLLAISADESVVLLVECTLRPNDIKKVGKLFHRAVDIAKELARTSELAPPVVPVLAIAAPLDSVMRKLQTAGEDEEITVFALEHITTALEAVERGAPHEEIVATLPEPLKMGLRGLARYDLAPSDMY